MLWLLTLLACAGGKSEDADGAAGAETDPRSEWTGGDFWFSTTAVEDGCMGGALRILFMPEGSEEPHRFEHLIYLPAYEEMPLSQTIDLRDPFMEMPITIDEGPDGVLQARGSVMESVELGGNFGDCVATMAVDVDLSPIDATTAEGYAHIGMTDVRGDEVCPVMDDEDCLVVLTLAAQLD